MSHKHLRYAPVFLLAQALVFGQGRGVTPAELLQPLKDSWPTYNGDYTGRRYSALTQVNQATVKHLSLAWMTRVTSGAGNAAGGGGGRGGRGGGGGNLIVGGEGTGDF